MIGKMLTGTAGKEEPAVLKGQSQKEGDGKNLSSATVFKALLASLQGEEKLLAGEQKSGSDNPEEVASSISEEQESTEGESVYRNITQLLSESDLQGTDLGELKQLLAKLKQQARESGSSVQEIVNNQIADNEGKGRQVGPKVEVLKESHAGEGEKLIKPQAATSPDEAATNGKETEKNSNDKLTKEGPAKVIQAMMSESESREAKTGEAGNDKASNNSHIVLQGGAEIGGGSAGKNPSGDISAKELQKDVDVIKGSSNISSNVETDLKNAAEDNSQPEAIDNKGELVSDKKDQKAGVKQRTALGSLLGEGSKQKEFTVGLNSMAGQHSEGMDSEKVPNGENGNAASKGDQRIETTQSQKQIVDSIFLKSTSGAASDKGIEMAQVQAETSRKKESRSRLNDSSSRTKSNSSRGSLLGFTTISETGKQNYGPQFEGVGPVSGSTGNAEVSVGELEFMWKEHSAETDGTNEEKESGQGSSSAPSLKLGQVPIANGSLRTKVLESLTKNVAKAASEAKKAPEQWQKHNFVLDDGKNMQLSVREAKGVLQVKMGSMNLELSKLLQQNLQQIREHLRQEFGSEVDLQFENNGQGSSPSGFSEGFSSTGGGSGNDRISGGNRNASAHSDHTKLKAIRNFGYNQMEWTA